MDNATVTQNRPSKTKAIRKKPNLREIALACVGHVLFADKLVEPVGQEQIFLYKHYERFRDHTDFNKMIEQCRDACDTVDANLVQLVESLSISTIELVTIVLAIMVEEDPLVGRLFAFIQAPVGGARPSLGMLETVLRPLATNPRDWISGNLLSGSAIENGVLQIINEKAPVPEQAVKVPVGLALVLRGKTLVWPGVSGLVGSERVNLPLSMLKTAARHASVLKNEKNSILVLRSASHSETKTIAMEIAAQLEREPLLISGIDIELHGLGISCTIGNYLPVFAVQSGVEEIKLIPALKAYSGPRLVIAGPDGKIDALTGSVMQWNITPPSQQERRELWKEYLNEPELAEVLSTEHIHSAARIAELSRLSQREASLEQRERVVIEDIRKAAWEAESGSLGNLAEPITSSVSDEALVLSRTVEQELQQLLARCRKRELLDDSLGVTIKTRYQQGVRSLFSGPSGTGKTLAASWLATRLGLPLYRVDLASVVSKYIGETEKNLATLLSRAEHSEIVLLFDEADSLFGKRTDIKDSNDRFANSQTNYLLQRMESYRGIVILTSNSRDRFDSAFTRRIDRVVEFPLPSPHERRALWHAHIGEGHQLSARQINQLAVACDLAGGFIRNAVLTAAVEASENQRAIQYSDVVVGLMGEYKKLGRQFPSQLRSSHSAKSR